MNSITKESLELGRVFLKVRDICGETPDLVTLQELVDTVAHLTNFVSVRIKPHRNEEVQKVEDLLDQAWAKLYDARQALKVINIEKEIKEVI